MSSGFSDFTLAFQLPGVNFWKWRSSVRAVDVAVAWQRRHSIYAKDSGFPLNSLRE